MTFKHHPPGPRHCVPAESVGRRSVLDAVAHTTREGGEWIEGPPSGAFHTAVWADGWAYDLRLVELGFRGEMGLGSRYVTHCPFVKETADPVNLPNHYARFKIEPISFIGENKLDWFQGNVVKYVCRHDAKNGIEDLRKARRYLDMYIRYLSCDVNWWKADAKAS